MHMLVRWRDLHDRAAPQLPSYAPVVVTTRGGGAPLGAKLVVGRDGLRSIAHRLTAPTSGDLLASGPFCEPSFSLDTVDPYDGLAGTIRTDATLRNVQGDIIAIYDVKTGAQTISRARADELWAKTRAAPDTPVFELNVVRGISRKQIVLSIFRSRSRARPMTRGI
ncbi:hypothetical protein [Rhodopseudomonas sp. BR0M22]|uniref:hypothetical protein n=1 Tax=Rhodopseudomonas sp. BR0M22 TaxID=2269369 RepID=UPI0013E04F3D|nr:hypothetical protein [Rhodopseudomonas sp. BR0M22]